MPLKLIYLLFFTSFSLLAEDAINTKKPDVYMGRQIAYTMHVDAA